MINITNMTKTYTMGKESIYALNQINLLIKKGEFVSIIGASGSRKIYINEYDWSFRCSRRRKIFTRWYRY